MDFSEMTTDELITQFRAANDEYVRYIRQTPVKYWNEEFDRLRSQLKGLNQELKKRSAGMVQQR